MVQIITIDDGVIPRLLGGKRYATTGTRRKELRNNRKDMRIRARREPVILLRPAVAFRREEFDVRLFRGEEGHWIALLPFLVPFLLVLVLVLVVLPEAVGGEAVVETGVGEGAEGEGGEEACFVCFPEVVGCFKGVVVVD